MEGDTEKTLSSPPILAPKPAQEEEDTPRRSGRVRKPAVVAVVPPDGPKQTPAGSVLGTKPIHPFFQKKANPVAPVPLPASPTQTAEPPVLSSIPDMFLSADQRKAKRAEQLKQSVEQTKQWDSEFWKGRSANPFLQPKKPSTPDNDANRSASPAPKRVFVIQDPTEAPWPDSCNVHVERATAATDNSSLRWPFRELAPQAVHQKAYGMVWIDEPSGTAQEKPTQWPAPRHNSDQLWTEKYRPRLCADVCGNSEQVNKLRDWLKRWQPSADDALERTVDVVRKRRRKLVADPSSDDDFVTPQPRTVADSDDFVVTSSEDESDEDEDDAKNGPSLAPAIVLCGPTGSGKTSALAAVCAELDIEILESNCTQRRTGKDLQQLFGESTQSHLVVQSWMAAQAAAQHEEQQEREQEQAKKNARKRKAKKVVILPTPPPAQAQPTGTLNKLSLILIEEGDLLYDEDKGFWNAINDFIATTKRPIVITCNEPANIHQQLDSELEWFHLTRPSRLELVALLQKIATAEDLPVSLAYLNAIAQDCDDDIRKSILTLQALGGLPVQPRANPLADEAANDIHSFFDANCVCHPEALFRAFEPEMTKRHADTIIKQGVIPTRGKYSCRHGSDVDVFRSLDIYSAAQGLAHSTGATLAALHDRIAPQAADYRSGQIDACLPMLTARTRPLLRLPEVLLDVAPSVRQQANNVVLLAEPARLTRRLTKASSNIVEWDPRLTAPWRHSDFGPDIITAIEEKDTGPAQASPMDIL